MQIWEYVLRNKTPKPLKNFDIKTDHPVPARRPDLVVNIKKKNMSNHVLWIIKLK